MSAPDNLGKAEEQFVNGAVRAVKKANENIFTADQWKISTSPGIICFLFSCVKPEWESHPQFHLKLPNYVSHLVSLYVAKEELKDSFERKLALIKNTQF